MHIVFQLIRWVPSRTKCFRMHWQIARQDLPSVTVRLGAANLKRNLSWFHSGSGPGARLPCAVTPAAHRAHCPWTQALAVLSDCQRDSNMLLFHGFPRATSQRPSEEASAASASAVSTPRLTGKYPPRPSDWAV
jgi:hypothetical protein